LSKIKSLDKRFYLWYNDFVSKGWQGRQPITETEGEMAKLYRVSEDKAVEIKPKNGRKFKLAEVQALVGGYVEVVGYMSSDKHTVLVDEEGMLKCKLPNLNFYFNAPLGCQRVLPLVGDVLVVGANEFD
jgi:hypothetical protein